MDIQIIEHIKETLSVVIQCNKIDDEVMRLKSHIESFDNKLYAQKDGTQFWVNLSEVLYFESVDNHTFLYTQEDVMEIKQRLYELEEILSDKDFVRISKSLIVNINKIFLQRSNQTLNFYPTKKEYQKISKMICDRMYKTLLKK